MEHSEQEVLLTACFVIEVGALKSVAEIQPDLAIQRGKQQSHLQSVLGSLIQNVLSHTWKGGMTRTVSICGSVFHL